MGTYRPRPSESRNCQHCASSFATNHKRARYCGESCRQLAYQARRKTQSLPAPAQAPASELSFSIKNVGVAAAGAGAVALTNYLVNDRPVQQALMAQLSQLSRRVEALSQALQAHGLPVPPDPQPVHSSLTTVDPKSTIVENERPMTLDEIAYAHWRDSQ